MVAYYDRNFLVASIPTERLNVHLKKWVLNLAVNQGTHSYIQVACARLQSWRCQSSRNSCPEESQRQQKCTLR